MDSDNQKVIYCEDDGEYRMYCDVCEKLCLERFYNNHLKSGTHITVFHKRQRIKITNAILHLFPLK